MKTVLQVLVILIVSITIGTLMAELFLIPHKSGYNKGVCHGKYGTGSTYTNGECFIPITK